MTQYLRNFGLNHLAEAENCLMLIRHVCEKGKVFEGYRCNYYYTDKEAVYGYFANEARKIRESGREFHTEIVMLQSPQPESGLLVSVGDRKTLATIGLSDRNRLQTIHIRLSNEA
ncbi:MAG: hypothetical protein LBR71_01310 [Synergistaceae bacterium]|jgi:hypothetical protein|nr:hypothetical protein [Synergistaceae bacterium]